MNNHPFIYSIGLVVALTLAHAMNRQLSLEHQAPAGSTGLLCRVLAP
jgi:hypothetical protein